MLTQGTYLLWMPPPLVRALILLHLETELIWLVVSSKESSNQELIAGPRISYDVHADVDQIKKLKVKQLHQLKRSLARGSSYTVSSTKEEGLLQLVLDVEACGPK